MIKEWTREGCKTVVNENGLYKRFCGECGRNEKEHNKQYEKGYYSITVTTYCKCGNKYEYMS
jgi:hypothetical protein